MFGKREFNPANKHPIPFRPKRERWQVVDRLSGNVIFYGSKIQCQAFTDGFRGCYKEKCK